MKRIALLIALVPSVALADKSYNSEQSATHDCNKDPVVSINASGGTFTLTGTCDKVGINGSSNTVTIESVKKLGVNGASNKADVGAAEKIGVAGSSNTITYKTGLGGKGKPKVGSVGVGNKVTQVK